MSVPFTTEEKKVQKADTRAAESNVTGMDPLRFMRLTLIALASVIILSCGFHILVDVYGLFRPVAGRVINVYHHERISKYLLMHRYIPANYNAMIIGTSLSDNLDVSTYNAAGHPLRFYNASLMGANISEVRKLALKGIEGGIRNMVFCVSPYQFKDTGAKEVELDSRLYFGALGSKSLYETYLVAALREVQWMPGKYPRRHITGDGVNHFNQRFHAADVAERIALVEAAHRGKPFDISDEAVEEFRALITAFRREQVNYLVYFHPVPDILYDAQNESYARFEQLIKVIVSDDSRMLDFNGPSWRSFTSDYSHYIDNGHLSEKGGAVVLDSVMQYFDKTNSSLSD
jgi:hypothetical protein